MFCDTFFCCINMFVEKSLYISARIESSIRLNLLNIFYVKFTHFMRASYTGVPTFQACKKTRFTVIILRSIHFSIFIRKSNYYKSFHRNFYQIYRFYPFIRYQYKTYLSKPSYMHNELWQHYLPKVYTEDISTLLNGWRTHHARLNESESYISTMCLSNNLK